jgi:C_GCAxxG_C_C family probable redox protein
MTVAAPSGGGMEAMGGTCGAVTGAFMVLGLKHGVKDPEHMSQKKSEMYGEVQKFAKRFTEKNRFLLCGELMGCAPLFRAAFVPSGVPCFQPDFTAGWLSTLRAACSP